MPLKVRAARADSKANRANGNGRLRNAGDCSGDKGWSEMIYENEYLDWNGLSLKEIDEIIDGNMTITDHRLRDAIYAIIVDVETTLLEKNSDKRTEQVPFPEGYEIHELPADYTGRVWIEGQVRRLHAAATGDSDD